MPRAAFALCILRFLQFVLVFFAACISGILRVFFGFRCGKRMCRLGRRGLRYFKFNAPRKQFAVGYVRQPRAQRRGEQNRKNCCGEYRFAAGKPHCERQSADCGLYRRFWGIGYHAKKTFFAVQFRFYDAKVYAEHADKQGEHDDAEDRQAVLQARSGC